MVRNIIGKIFSPQPSGNHHRHNYATWKGAKRRLIPEVWPEYTPSFQINKKEKIFTIGSCFARNIEEYLVRLGCRVPMMSFAVPKDEWPNRPNGILNQYSPATIFQELDWCDQIHAEGGKVTFGHVEPLLFKCENGLFIDMHIGGYVPVTKERALGRRQEIYDVFAHVFSSAVVIMTLGMIEVWYDLKNHLFIQRVPSEKMKKDMERFKFICLSYRECHDYIQKSISLIMRHRPECKFLMTTSPVPLKETFTHEDIITANTYSKSVLRAVCGEIVSENKQVDYFPSFESVTLTRDWSVFEKDLRHVSDGFVQKLVARLCERYVTT